MKKKGKVGANQKKEEKKETYDTLESLSRLSLATIIYSYFVSSYCCFYLHCFQLLLFLSTIDSSFFYFQLLKTPATTV